MIVSASMHCTTREKPWTLDKAGRVDFNTTYNSRDFVFIFTVIAAKSSTQCYCASSAVDSGVSLPGGSCCGLGGPQTSGAAVAAGLDRGPGGGGGAGLGRRYQPGPGPGVRCVPGRSGAGGGAGPPAHRAGQGRLVGQPGLAHPGLPGRLGRPVRLAALPSPAPPSLSPHLLRLPAPPPRDPVPVPQPGDRPARLASNHCLALHRKPNTRLCCSSSFLAGI